MTGSLQGRLIRRLTAVIGLVALVSGVLSFYNAYADAQELQDEFLGQVAATMRPAGVTERLPGADGSVDPGSESRLIVQSIDSGTLLAPGALALAPDLVDGLQTVDLPNGRFRVVVRTLPGGRRFAVAQPTEMRDDIALDSAFNTVLPLAVLAPMLALLTMLLVKATLAPVQRIAHEVDGRSENDLNPLPTDGLRLSWRPSSVPSTACWRAWPPRWRRSAASWPMRRTSCARRWPRCPCRPNTWATPRCPTRPGPAWTP
jgi:two-component system OmpR family sensor kinase